MQLLIDEYTDRYGKLKEEIILYMEEKYLESLLKKSGVESFKETDDEIKIIFDEETSKKNITKMLDEIKDFGFNTVIVLLRLRYQFDYRLKKVIMKLNPKNTNKSYIYGLNQFLEKMNEQFFAK